MRTSFQRLIKRQIDRVVFVLVVAVKGKKLYYELLKNNPKLTAVCKNVSGCSSGKLVSLRALMIFHFFGGEGGL